MVSGNLVSTSAITKRILDYQVHIATANLRLMRARFAYRIEFETINLVARRINCHMDFTTLTEILLLLVILKTLEWDSVVNGP
jgi:DNA-binding TFAR19-related protein (PDSD5 family)